MRVLTIALVLMLAACHGGSSTSTTTTGDNSVSPQAITQQVPAGQYCFGSKLGGMDSLPSHLKTEDGNTESVYGISGIGSRNVIVGWVYESTLHRTWIQANGLMSKKDQQLAHVNVSLPQKSARVVSEIKLVPHLPKWPDLQIIPCKRP